MAKITALEQKTFQGKPSGFKITFDDGRSGNLQEKESSKGLRVGDIVDVKEIPYTSKAGVASTLYGATLVGGSPTSAGTSAPQPKPSSAPQTCGCNDDITAMKFEARIEVIKLAHGAFLAGKLEEGDAIRHCKEWVIMADDLINELRK